MAKVCIYSNYKKLYMQIFKMGIMTDYREDKEYCQKSLTFVITLVTLTTSGSQSNYHKFVSWVVFNIVAAA